MPARLRPLLFLLLAAVASLAVAACGGDEKKTASSDTDVDTLLKNTFSGKKKVDAGKLDLTLRIDAKGAQGVNGPITLKLGGPFQSQGAQKLPKFKIDFAFEGAGQSIKAGLTSTGQKGFVNFQGNDYAVSDQVFTQFRKGYEQAQRKGNKSNQSLSTLGLNPRNWLTGAKNAGEAKVGGDDTIKITGGVDVAKLLDDANTALQRTRELGVQGSKDLPAKLTEAQKQQVADAVRDIKVEIYTGKDDSILRRMVIALGIVAPKETQGGGSAKFNLDLSMTGLNEDQEIVAPSSAKPFEQLLSSLGGLGLGGLGGAGSGSGSGSGSTGGAGSGSTGGSGSSGSTGGSSANLEKYSQCVTEAGNDAAKARKCADLLTNP
ncbi:MAG TPA: hypothetical protein VES79_06620 [Solirubrobacteraceae bacterium]|nr:hypothetical protein [Solirubrobacteraceae bacterium]